MKITASVNEIAYLESLRQQMQRHRIQMGNRIAAIERGDSEGNQDIAEYFAGRFEGIESEIAGLIADGVKEHPVYPWLDAVKGIGPGLSGALLAPIDIHRANSISALWRYAGQGVNSEGQRDRPTKGKKLPYNANLKKTCYLIGTSFMRAGSPYRAEYDTAKEFYTVNRPDWTKGHCDMAAKRRMIKMFLSHLWVVWRDVEGLPLSAPYASSQLRHDGIVPPWRYVPDFEYSHALREHYDSISRLAVGAK